MPVRARGELVGLIVAGAGTSSATSALSSALPGLVDFAEVAGVLLQPTLAAGSEAAVARKRLASVIEQASVPSRVPADHRPALAGDAGFEALTRFDDGMRPDIAFSDARRLGMEHELELATMREALRSGRARCRAACSSA